MTAQIRKLKGVMIFFCVYIVNVKNLLNRLSVKFDLTQVCNKLIIK